jgi:predicted branched-subunit amino acid permease
VEHPGVRDTVITAAPLALAIGVFGVLFGAAAVAHIEPIVAIAMSLLVFSGSLQFALIGSLAAGGGPLAFLLTAIVLNLRHFVMGALLRPHIAGSRLRRAALSSLMVDESFGLALASRRAAAQVLVISGAMFYVAWQVGTLLGVFGAQLVAMESLAAAVFPILFIGLAALTSRGRSDAARALIAGAAVLGLGVIVPQLHALLPVVVALLVALPYRGVQRT